MLPNLYFLARTATVNADAHRVVAAQIVVLHDSVLSSVFVTRLLATFAEVASIFLMACVLWSLNTDHVSG